jgi:hypothetical protein
MSISVRCPHCQRGFKVPETLAGKRFRCKGCQSIVNVPGGASAPANDDPFGFDMSAMEAGGEDEYGDWESRLPPPKKPVKKKRRSVPKEKPRTRSSANGSGVGKKLGGFFLALCVVGGIAKIGLRVAQRHPGIFNFASWSEYTTPEGEVTFEVPGSVQSRAGVVPSAPTAVAYMGEGRSYACGVIIEPMPLELQGFGPDQGLAFMEAGLPQLGATNVRRTTVTGRTAIAYDSTRNGFTNHCFVVPGTNAIYTFVFLYKDSFDESAQSRFLSSIRINQ